jgi:hypothetical protein
MDGDAHVSNGARSGGKALTIRMQDLQAASPPRWDDV